MPQTDSQPPAPTPRGEEYRRGFHPEQSRWCAIVSFLFGPKQRGGSSWHVDGTDYWWQCDRCSAGDSSL